MKMKKIVSVFLAASLVLSLAACGNSNDSASSKQNVKSSVKPVKLEYLGSKSEAEAIEAMNDIIAKYMKAHPNVTIEQTTVPDAKTVLLTRVAANEPPDIISFSTNATYDTLFDDGLLMDLTGQKFFDNINPSAVKMSLYKDKLYRLPIALSSWGIFINKKIYKDHGLEIPKTYEQLMANAKALTNAGVVAFINPDKELGQIGQRMERLMSIMTKGDDALFKKIAAGTVSSKDTPEFQGYVKAVLDMKKYGNPDSLGIDHKSGIADFANGKGAMYVFVTAALTTVKSSAPNMDFTMISYPNPNGGESLMPVSIDTSFSIFNSCKSLDVAVDFLSSLTQLDAAQIYADKERSPNVVKGVKYEVPEFSQITERLNKGEMITSLNSKWPNGLREDMRTPGQKLLIDGNVDAFYKAIDDAIKAKYKK